MTDTTDDFEIAPEELSRRLASTQPPFLLDVREPFEHAISALPGATLVPLATLPANAETLPRDREIVVYCHHGVRSARAVHYLRALGVERALSLAGGIDRWSLEVDPGVIRY